jgi:hypothetical protein
MSRAVQFCLVPSGCRGSAGFARAIELARQAQQELGVRHVAALVGVPGVVVPRAQRGTLPGLFGAAAPTQARSHRRTSRHGSRRQQS